MTLVPVGGLRADPSRGGNGWTWAEPMALPTASVATNTPFATIQRRIRLD
jgi:hypothetical protein